MDQPGPSPEAKVLMAQTISKQAQMDVKRNLRSTWEWPHGRPQVDWAEIVDEIIGHYNTWICSTVCTVYTIHACRMYIQYVCVWVCVQSQTQLQHL